MCSFNINVECPHVTVCADSITTEASSLANGKPSVQQLASVQTTVVSGNRETLSGSTSNAFAASYSTEARQKLGDASRLEYRRTLLQCNIPVEKLNATVAAASKWQVK